MSDKLETTKPLQPVTEIGDDLLLSATTPAEMRESQLALLEWCQRKVTGLKADAEELQGAYEHALKRKWKAATLKRHAQLAVKRLNFYEKVLAALQAGYIIVPSFPVTMFAIRTDKAKPSRMYRVDTYNINASLLQQSPPLLPAGEGHYVNPFPLVERSQTQEGDKVNRACWASAWDEFEFPLSMAKPQLMELADRAMALKVFDELGVLPSHKREPDPLIVGRIVYPGQPAYTRADSYRAITFIVAWHLDTRTL